MRGIERNYLQSTYLDFYYPIEFDSSLEFPNIPNVTQTLKDAVYGLFSNEGVLKLKNNVDYYSISSNY